jgi:enamine deaminase RidA (YjgF/YER057c/UK114 family)
MTWYVLDKNAYLSSAKEMGKVYREIIGSHYPAMSVVEVSGLVETNALVEIEVTAVVPD